MPVKEKVHLPDFEGRAVDKSTVRITKAGDGLSEALKLEPIALHHGDICYFVLKGVVTQVNHKPDGKVEDEEVDDLVRVHTIDATEIALVGAADVDALLARNKERIDALQRERESEAERQRKAEAGEMEMFDEGERPSELDALGPGADE